MPKVKRSGQKAEEVESEGWDEFVRRSEEDARVREAKYRREAPPSRPSSSSSSDVEPYESDDDYVPKVAGKKNVRPSSGDKRKKKLHCSGKEAKHPEGVEKLRKKTTEDEQSGKHLFLVSGCFLPFLAFAFRCFM
jgi:hypothetical protein